MPIRTSFGLPLAFAAVVLAGPAAAATINFDDQGLVGPSLYANVPAAQTLVIAAGGNTVTFNGGVILTNAFGLTQNTSSIYGTADFGNGLSTPMVIGFANPITNFLIDVFNGSSSTKTYRVEDNLGAAQQFTLAGFLGGGGFTTIGFATVGSQVSISSVDAPLDDWNFLVDNIRFDLPIQCGQNGCNPTVVPVPAALPLFLAGALGIAGFGFRRSRKQG